MIKEREPQTKDEVKGEPQTMRPTYELRGKEGSVSWSFKLVDLTGTLDVKTLKGEKAVCALLTAPGRSAYKLVKVSHRRGRRVRLRPHLQPQLEYDGGQVVAHRRAWR